ncbi:MAG: tetratricopeptide repeat protein [Vicingaceae bacterium]
MKNLLYTLLFLLSTYTYAQPGDIMGMNINRVNEINSLLKIDTNNHKLLWERLEIVFSPHFNLYTRSRQPISKSDSLIIGDGFERNKIFRDVDVLADLNYLLAHTVVIVPSRVSARSVTSANFHYKRGQYYYFNGEPDKALEDFLTALHKNPNPFLVERIYISIAAYYYNLSNGEFNLANLERALEYIDGAIPKAIEHTPETFEYYTERNHHPFEREKIMLLEITGKHERLANYLKSLAKSHLHLYHKEIQKSEEYQRNHSYSIPYTLDEAFDYLFQLSEVYYKNNNYKKAGEALNLIISYIPTNKKGFKKHSNNYGQYCLKLAEIYTKECCKDTLKEIASLSNAISGPSYGLNIGDELTHQLNENLNLHQDNSKILLAKAILIFKQGRGNITPESSQKIDSLLQQVEQSGFIDYKVHYLKGLVLKRQSKYFEAIQQFDKAIAIFDGNPHCYRQKIQILRKIPDYDDAKIKALEEKAKALTHPTAYSYPYAKNILQLIKQIDEL